MPGGTRGWTLGRVQCDRCARWFKPAGLHGHGRFYHGAWRAQLRSDCISLAEELLDYGPPPKDIGEMIDLGWPNLNEPELLYYRRKMEALLALHQISQ